MSWGITTMWHCKTAVKTCSLFLTILLAVSAEPSSRKSRLKRGRVNLPKAQKVFKKIQKKSILKYVKPPSAGRLYFDPGTDEAELERVTLEEIRQLYKLFQTSKRPDIQLRLASLYAEQARLIESRIYEKYTIEMEAYKEGMRKSLPRLNLSLVREYSQKAINLFSLYLRTNPKSRRRGEVLFQLGYSYFQIGKPHKGKEYYERLIKQHPRSRYLESALFHLGEYYFDQAKWKTARRHYQKASAFKSKFYSFSLYKLSWCFFNEGKVNTAMNVMARLIRESSQSSVLNFSKEALNDLSSFYIYSKKKASQAYAYFEDLAQNEKQVLKILEKVGRAYKDAGEIYRMRYIFNLLIELEPYRAEAFDFKYQIVQAFSYTGGQKIFNQEFKVWVKNYGPDSKWMSKNRSNKQLVKKSEDLMEVTIRNYVFRMQHAFIKTKRKSNRDQALLGYKLYTQVFPRSPFNSDIRFHYGELLFDMNQFEKAAEQYGIVVRKHPKSKNHHAAALNQVLALEKKLPSEKQVKALVKGKKLLKFSPLLKKFEKAVEEYMKFYPKKPETSNMIYTLAKLYYEHKNYQEAIKYWMVLINKYPKNENFARSIHSVLDAFNLLKEFDLLRKTAALFLKKPQVRRHPVAKEIKSILRQARFKQAFDLAQSKKFEESAKVYEQFFREYADSDMAVSALYNAALNYKKIDNFYKSASLYQMLSMSPQLGKHPKIQKQVLRDIGDVYQRGGQYSKAATNFKAYAEKYPKDSVSLNYLYNSAIIFDGMNRYGEAVLAYLKYYQRSRDKDRGKIYFFIGRIRERQRQKTKAIGNYTLYLNSPDGNKIRQVMAAFYIAELNRSLGRKTESLKWHRSVLRIYKKLSQGVSFAGRSQFHIALDTYNQFKKIKIPRNPALQAGAVQKKLKLLDKLKAQSKSVIQINYGPELVSALTLMGLSNDHLGKAIVRSPIPPGLSKGDRKKYAEGLRQTALPFQKAAAEYFNQAVEKSRKVKGFMPWLKSAQKLRQESLKKPWDFSEAVYSIHRTGL